MKRLIPLFLLMFVFGCSTPESVGATAMNILRGLNTKDEAYFQKQFLSYENVQELLRTKNVVVDTTFIKYYKSYTPLRYRADRAHEYDDLKASVQRNHIDLSLLTFENFHYEVTSLGKGKSLSGRLYFKSDGKLFSVHLWAIHDGFGYRLMHLGKIETNPWQI